MTERHLRLVPPLPLEPMEAECPVCHDEATEAPCPRCEHINVFPTPVQLRLLDAHTKESK